MRILITGGAGFVGSSLARAFKEDNPKAQIVVFDNLKRRGSELNLPIIKQRGIHFVHGDSRNPADLNDLNGSFDFAVEASAAPSVLAGLNGTPQYVLDTNLTGTLHFLEFARKRKLGLIYLSSSRVYSIGELRALKLKKLRSRYGLEGKPAILGSGKDGIAENFPINAPRSLYGSTKLASEILVEEYAHIYGLQAFINRCGVIVGPGQFGKTDQGVFTHWLASHYFNRPLAYTGFGGLGLQVRDVLHPQDLYALINKQVSRLHRAKGDVFNIGGGNNSSVSLREWTSICQQVTGNSLPISRDARTNSVDIPWYISDFKKASSTFAWTPKNTPQQIANDIKAWIRKNERDLLSLWG